VTESLWALNISDKNVASELLISEHMRLSLSFGAISVGNPREYSHKPYTLLHFRRCVSIFMLFCGWLRKRMHFETGRSRSSKVIIFYTNRKRLWRIKLRICDYFVLSCLVSEILHVSFSENDPNFEGVSVKPHRQCWGWPEPEP